MEAFKAVSVALMGIREATTIAGGDACGSMSTALCTSFGQPCGKFYGAKDATNNQPINQSISQSIK